MPLTSCQTTIKLSSKFRMASPSIGRSRRTTWFSIWDRCISTSWERSSASRMKSSDLRTSVMMMIHLTMSKMKRMERTWALLTSMPKPKTVDLRLFTDIKTSLRFGSRISLANGSSSRTHSLTTSDWWSCTWAFQTGTTRSLRLGLTHRHSSGLGSFHLNVSRSILKTVAVKRLSLERKTTEPWLLRARPATDW